MLPKEGKVVCTKCGNSKKIKNRNEFKLSEKKKEKKGVVIIEEDMKTLPKTRAECPKCKNMEAEWWLLQTRGADEPETRFLRCTKCSFTWREYN